MVVESFPPVELANEFGLLAVGGDLDVETLVLAYSSGIFPWPSDDGPLPWFAPARRAILFFDDFKIPRSLNKQARRNEYEFSIDRAFEEVIANCAVAREEGSWITEPMQKAYSALHRAGYAHSVECYSSGKLVGGLYGVSIGSMFAGESMFYKESNASKLCLCHLVDYLAKQDVNWIDCQQLTPLFESFGAKEIPRDKFMKLLGRSIVEKEVFLAIP